MTSLLLSLPGVDPFTDSGWDLTLDSAGNIALATGDYAVAQDVACACRTFAGELWYDTTRGIPYLQNFLGFRPSLQFLKSVLIGAASVVPGFGSVQIFLTGPGNNGVVGGQIQLTNSQGEPIGSINTTDLQGTLPWYIQAAQYGAYSTP